MRPRPGRRGVASVIGTMLFVVVLMAGIAALVYVSSIQAQSTQSAQQAQQLLSQREKESLTYQALSGGTLALANAGPSGSTIRYVILKFANGTLYQFSPNQSVSAGNLLSVPSLIPNQSCGLSTCLSKYNTILSSTNTGDSIGVVTSLGNVFWEKPALAVQASTPGTTYSYTFDASGTSSFGANPVVTVDGAGYAASQLPVTLTWFAGTKHTYSFATSLPLGTGSRVGVASVQGVSTSASGSITSTSTGTIRASYSTQYLLTVSGGSAVAFIGSPANDGWYNSGSTGQFTSNYVWNVVSGSRSNLVSYSLDGSSPASVARSGAGTYTSIGITMNAPHTITLTPTTQYQLTVSGGNGVSYSLASQTNDGWYDSGSTLTVSSNYVWSQVAGQSRQNILSYTLDGTTTNSARSNSGACTTPTITMNASHVLTFNPVTQYYLTISGGASTAIMGSQTSDGWFDGGSSAQAQSGYSWSTITGQSRSNLYSYAIDGGSPTTISSRAGSGTYTTPSITMNTYHTLTFDPVTQYFLTVNGGTSLVYTTSPTSDGWYDAGTSAQVTTNYVWSVVAGQSRQDLTSWNVDGGANTNIARSGSGTLTVTATASMTTYHTVNFNGVTQYTLNANGGSSISYSGSITDDGWYDSGSTWTATTNYVWGVVAGQSRLNLVSWNLDGGANQAVTRAGSGTFTTTSVTMNTFHTINFNSVTQYYVTVQNSVPSSGSTGSVTVSYSYNQQQSSNQLLSNPGFASGTSGWNTMTMECYCTSLVAVTSPVYDGSSYSGQASDPNAGRQGAVFYQVVSFPSGTTTVSGTVSGWVYYPNNPTTNDYLGEVYGEQSSGGFGPSGYSANTWYYLSFPIVAGASLPTSSWFDIQADNSVSYWDDLTWSMTWQYPVSGSTGSSSNTFSVSGTTVTYTYGIGYTFPSSNTNGYSWSVSTAVGSEAYQSNTCSITPSGGTIAGSSSQSCTMTTTYGGSYSSSIGASQTNDGWYDSGTSGVMVSASGSGPFSFGSWSAQSGITVASSGLASTTVTVNNYGTVTANFNVNQ